jgi:RNA polymerase sigma-70 factor, ECF subfamily
MSEDEVLVTKVQAGDSAAFGTLYDNYIDKIYRFIYYKTFSKELAEDLTSDTFMKALEKIHTFDVKRGRFSTWLYQIARNTVIDYMRKSRPEVSLEDDWDFGFDERTVERLDAISDLKKVEAFLDTLPARSREIVTLRVWEGHSYAEIAELIGGTEASIKMSFSRTLKQMKQSVGPAALVLMWSCSPFSLPFTSLTYYINIWLT